MSYPARYLSAKPLTRLAQSAYRTITGDMAESILERVGNTPLIGLTRLGLNKEVRLYGKAEWLNPTGSVKDRTALSIIKSAERDGRLTDRKTILDATSGNAGISYSMIAAARGYRVKLAIPRNANQERKQILHAYGVELIFTDPIEGSDGAVRKAREIYNENTNAYFYADQYSNDANWRAHYEATGVEIWNQTEGAITHLVAGVGTGGTLMGAGRRLREYRSNIEIIAVQPDSPFHGLEGLKHMASSVRPKIYDPSFPNRVAEISTEEAQRTVKELARKEGILVGPSSGAAVATSLRVAKEAGEGTIVTILPDGGERYLSERFWDGV